MDGFSKQVILEIIPYPSQMSNGKVAISCREDRYYRVAFVDPRWERNRRQLQQISSVGEKRGGGGRTRTVDSADMSRVL